MLGFLTVTRNIDYQVRLASTGAHFLHSEGQCTDRDILRWSDVPRWIYVLWQNSCSAIQSKLLRILWRNRTQLHYEVTQLNRLFIRLFMDDMNLWFPWNLKVESWAQRFGTGKNHRNRSPRSYRGWNPPCRVAEVCSSTTQKDSGLQWIIFTALRSMFSSWWSFCSSLQTPIVLFFTLCILFFSLGPAQSLLLLHMRGYMLWLHHLPLPLSSAFSSVSTFESPINKGFNAKHTWRFIRLAYNGFPQIQVWKNAKRLLSFW